MNLDHIPPGNAAGQALSRILRLALPDEEACQRALRDALRSANKVELPSDGEELLTLVRAHLAPQLSRDVAPNLVFALIDDLKAEIELQRAIKDPTSSARLKAATCFPPPVSPPATPPASERREGGVVVGRLVGNDTPFPKLRASVSHLRRTTATALRVAHPGGQPPPAPAPVAADPASVVLVEADRMMRASLARSLVGAHFDVSVMETSADLVAWLPGHDEEVIAIIDVTAEGAEAGLRSLAETHPALSVIACTDAPAAVVEGILATLGLQRYRIVPKGASAQVVDGVRALLAKAPTGT